MSLEVPASASGERLDRFLVALAKRDILAISGLSRARLQALVDSGEVSVDGRPGRSGQRLRGGEAIVIHVPPPVASSVVAEPMALAVLYEDQDLIVVAKPAGLVVHPGAGRMSGTLVSGLLAHCRDLSGVGGVLRPGIVHRLDRGTSGVLVVAKHDAAHLALAQQFSARRVTKIYKAFVHGTPRPARATIETLYGRHPKKRQRFTGKLATGKRAITSYEVIASGGGVSALRVVLGTGRTHQIRVHLAELGHPIVADATYGGCDFRRLCREVRSVAERLDHQALHACELGFRHPREGTDLHFVAPLPDDLSALDRAIMGVVEAEAGP